MKTITQDLRWALACAAGALVLSPAAFAAGTWGLGNSCTVSGGIDTTGNSYACASSNASDPSATVSAWSAPSGSAFAAAAIGNYDPNGYGVRNSGENGDSPNDAMDNSGRLDTILLSFDSSVILNQLTTGWAAYDSDVSVLRYVPTTSAPTIAGETAGGLLGSGWELVGDYGNTVANVAQNNSGTSNTTPRIINSSNKSSSYWLISAYSPSFGGASWSSTNDYVKLLSVAGTPVVPGGTTPEPASLALVAVALAGMGAARRREKVTRTSIK